MKTVQIDGNAFDDIDSFYDEAQRKLCPTFKGFGRNLNAFNDILRAGFGLFEYGEPIMLIWENSAKSRADLNHKIDSGDTAQTLFDRLIDIIKDNGNVTLQLK